MRINTGTVRSFHIQWLLVFSNNFFLIFEYRLLPTIFNINLILYFLYRLIFHERKFLDWVLKNFSAFIVFLNHSKVKLGVYYCLQTFHWGSWFRFTLKNMICQNTIRTIHGCCEGMLLNGNSIDRPNCEGQDEETINQLLTKCPLFKYHYWWQLDIKFPK